MGIVAASMVFVRSFSTSSRPALRTAACGGRPRAGNDTTAPGEPASPYLAAVFISNLPESISSTAGLVTGGWPKTRVLWMWVAIALVSGLAFAGRLRPVP
jgi:hypothetical protein